MNSTARSFPTEAAPPTFVVGRRQGPIEASLAFLATTRADSHHVVTANAHSKAVLRVAAEEVVRSNRYVHDFPSYETVTECTSEPWDSDQRHVSRDAVSRVMALFDAMFVLGETS